MIPDWKIKREISRFGQQLKAIPEALYEPILRKRHDEALRRGFPTYNGDVALAGKIAVLLVFQPSGLAASTLETLRYLAANGFAPFVVANHPLSPADQERLQPVVWRAMKRPNFGYDFGGYRDAVKMLEHWDIDPEHLLVMNDSIWFPTVASDGLLEFALSIKTGVGGTILRERGETRFLESYFYSVPKSTLGSDAWKAFWRSLKLTSNKYKVIRRGERGFSEAMAQAGLKLQPAFPYSSFRSALAEQSDAFLEKTLRYAANNYEETELQSKALLNNQTAPNWREDVVQHIQNTIPREQPYSAYPFAMVRLFDYPIVKKSNDRVAQFWRAAYLRAIDANDLPAPPDVVLDELRRKVAKDAQ